MTADPDNGEYRRLVDDVCSCWTPIVSHESMGGSDIREIPCGECNACRLHDILAGRPDYEQEP